MIDTLIANFHFLRPLWLLGLLPCIALSLWLRFEHKSSGNWNKVISKHLLPFLLDETQEQSSSRPIAALSLLWVLSIIAIAGPSWKQLPQPVFEKKQARVVILDLSYSMYASDLKPSRISRARLKLIDFLNNNREGLNALVVYSGDAHVVAPLTSDVNTIISLVPALEPSIMPSIGSDVVAAVDKATRLLIDGKADKGQILLIGDSIQTDEIKKISKLLSNSPYQLSVLGIGSTQGGPVTLPSGQFLKNASGSIVIPKLQEKNLIKLSQTTGGIYVKLTHSEQDISRLSSLSDNTLDESTRETELNFDVWQEEGQWLMFPILLLASFAFRRGWILSWLLVIPLSALLFASNKVYAEPPLPMTPNKVQTSQNTLNPPSNSSHGNPLAGIRDTWAYLWKTGDQRGTEAFSKGDFQSAAKYFKTQDWKASAQYHAGDFQSAADNFAINDTENITAKEHYNLGNALAKTGALDEAVSNYEKALTLEPKHEDALFNKALVEEVKRQQSENNQDSQDKSDENKNDGEPQEDGENQDGESQEGEPQEGEQDEEKDGEQQESEEKPQDSNQEDGEKGENGEPENQDKTSQQKDPSDSQADSEESDANKNDQEANEGEQKSTEPNKGSDNSESLTPLQKEQQQALEQWLRRVPDDPSGLLKRKFQLEAEQNRRSGNSINRKTQAW